MRAVSRPAVDYIAFLHRHVNVAGMKDR